MARTAFEWAPHKCANAVNIDTYGYMCVTWALCAIACRRNRHTHTPRIHVRAPASSTSNFLVFAVVTSACSVTELHANARAYILLGIIILRTIMKHQTHMIIACHKHIINKCIDTTTEALKVRWHCSYVFIYAYVCAGAAKRL